MKRIPPKLQPWFDARRRHKLTHAQIHMARELGMNPAKFGKLVPTDAQRWKAPLHAFIAHCYFKRFGRDTPLQVVSLEELITRDEARRERKLARKADWVADTVANEGQAAAA